jgi:hypothetical protein
MYVMLTLDLNYASTKEREKFYDHLEAEKWKKFDNVSTAWYLAVGQGMPRKTIIELVQACLKRADKAAMSKILDYEAVIGFCDDMPITISS